ncbi:MAG: hypothetical protein V3T88_09075 [Nitrosomonadaceae bacterium]
MSEPKLTTLYKPCGKEVVVNNNSLSHALSLGWTTRETPEEKTEAKQAELDESKAEPKGKLKRKHRTKAADEAVKKAE